MRRALLLCLAACAHPAAPRPGDPPAGASPGGRTRSAAGDSSYSLAAIRADADGLLRDQAAAWWKAWTTGSAVDAEAAWKGRERLLDPRTLGQVTAASRAAAGAEGRALFLLRAFLVGEQLAHAAAGPTEALAVAEAETTFTWDGRRFLLGDFAGLVAAEAEPARRLALDRAWAAAAGRLAPLADARIRALEAAARRMGSPSLLDLAAEVRGESPAALSALAEAVLAATEASWREVAEDVAHREVSLPLAQVRQRDLPRMGRLAHEARAFPAARLLDDGATALRDLGLDLGALPGLAIDSASRPGKNPRPLMLPLEVPGAVRVSVLPAGGAAEARAFLRELGAGVALACVGSPVMEFRRLGPAAGAWGRLFAALTGHPDWLSERAKLSNHGLGREVRAAWLERLHEVRLAAARLAAEVESSRSPGRTAEIRARLLGRAITSDPDPAAERALPRDPMLQSAETLRAELLAAQAEVFLSRRAGGAPWWRSRDNGGWLRGVWADGSRPTAGELAVAMGFSSPEPSALGNLARERLAVASRP